jgi:hypothetical protein
MPEEHPTTATPPPERRFEEVIAAKNTAIAERDTALAQLAATKTELASRDETIAAHLATIEGHATVVQQHADAAAGWASKEAQWGEREKVYQLGLTDPAAHRQARFDYEATDKSVPYPDWVQAQQANPEQAPRGLAAYLTGVPATATPATPTPATAAPAAPPTPTPAPAPAAAPVTPAPVSATPAAAPPQPAGGRILPTGAGGSSPPTAEQLKDANAQLKKGNAAPWKALRGQSPHVQA